MPWLVVAIAKHVSLARRRSSAGNAFQGTRASFARRLQPKPSLKKQAFQGTRASHKPSLKKQAFLEKTSLPRDTCFFYNGNNNPSKEEQPFQGRCVPFVTLRVR